jgi:hypothetical protein
LNVFSHVIGSRSKLLANPAVAVIVAPVLLALSLALPTPAGAQPKVPDEPPVAPDAVLKAFSDRVSAYVAMKKKLEADVPRVKPGDGATGRVESREQQLTARLREARKEAKVGDIFGDAAAYFRQTIVRDTATRGVRDAYAAMQEVPPRSPPAVNATYPKEAALATVPPLILVNLPRLPDGLEYRFMGRDLILRDRDANLVVDFVRDAVPAIRQ